jgi:AraC-like DNA-binding protein
LFTFSYLYCDHVTYLNKIASAAGVSLQNNLIFLPPAIGSGYIKVIELANGLQVLINECTLNQNVSFIRQPLPHQSYTLRFDEVKNLKQLTLQIDEEKISDEPMFYSGAFLSNSLTDLAYTATAGTEDRCINIYFTAQWLEENTGIKATDTVFNNYFSLKTASLNYEVLNLDYRQLMEEIFEIESTHPMQKVIVRNRVMLLLETFFRNIYRKMSGENVMTVSEVSVKRVMQVESILVSNLKVPAPTIPELARVAMMSETKLKNVFKAVYGHNIYTYYQKNRMLKARQMLRTKKMSVKETGLALGFKNLSNFTIAYKKEFNILPSEA